MVARLTCICIDAVDPRPIAEFWSAVLGWPVVDEDEAGISLGDPSQEMLTIDVLVVPDSKKVKNRVHLDLRADGTTFDEELTRLLGLGARRVDIGQGPDVTWVVLADPDGNEFCLLRRTVQEMAE